MASHTVWKYSISLTQGEAVLDMPKGARILHFGPGPDDPPNRLLSIWAEVHHPEGGDVSTADVEPRRFIVVGTGHQLPVEAYVRKQERFGEVMGVTQWAHCGSCVCGPFVWHLFEGTQPRDEQ